MKKGKAVYKSGKLTAIVCETLDGVPRIDILGSDDEDDDCIGALDMTLDDMKHLREIVRMLETYELTGPTRRER
jgi:hypothetical protein